MTVCSYFLEGRCRYGDKCWNEHPRGGRNQTSRGGGGSVNRVWVNPSQRSGGGAVQPSTFSRGGEDWGRGTSGPGRDERSSNFSFNNQNRFSALSNTQSGYGRTGGRGGGGEEGDDDAEKQLDVIQKDMEAWQSSGQWLFSCYAVLKASITGFVELSPEELRMEYYTSRATGDIQSYANSVQQLVNQWRSRVQELRTMNSHTRASMVAEMSNPVFSSTTSASAGFGSAPSTASAGFGSTASAGFGSAPSTASAGFGSTASAGFGSAPSTASAGFGSTASAGFGSVPPTASAGFGSTASAGFGSVPPTASAGFGSVPPSGFGSSSSGFQGGGFGSSVQSSAAGFSFSASSPGFGSSGGQSAPSQFGSSGGQSAPSQFGSSGGQSAPSQFGSSGGQSAPSQFGSSAPSASSFSFTHPAGATVTKSSSAGFGLSSASAGGFGGSSAAPGGSAEDRRGGGELYTPLSDLAPDELREFSAKRFTLGQIPLRAPPAELLNV